MPVRCRPHRPNCWKPNRWITPGADCSPGADGRARPERLLIICSACTSNLSRRPPCTSTFQEDCPLCCVAAGAPYLQHPFACDTGRNDQLAADPSPPDRRPAPRPRLASRPARGGPRPRSRQRRRRALQGLIEPSTAVIRSPSACQPQRLSFHLAFRSSRC